MSRKPDRGTKTAPPKVLDAEARKRQVRHHLDSLERDNFVALNEYEAIIATAAAAATAQGPISLTHTNLDPLGILPPLGSSVGSIVGGVVGTIGLGAVAAGNKPSGTLSGSRSKKHNIHTSSSNTANHGNSSSILNNSSASSSSPMVGSRKPLLSRKPLSQLLEESGLLTDSLNNSIPTYVTAAMGPSRYPDRQFCSVCGWKGRYRCNRCGMRYCDLKCLRTHEDTRCMKFTI